MTQVLRFNYAIFFSLSNCLFVTALALRPFSILSLHPRCLSAPESQYVPGLKNPKLGGYHYGADALIPQYGRRTQCIDFPP